MKFGVFSREKAREQGRVNMALCDDSAIESTAGAYMVRSRKAMGSRNTLLSIARSLQR